jgi:fibronectin type 3 domain-containing protein
VAILPPDTIVFTDTRVLENTRYAYRVQMLDSEGNDSDFSQTLEEILSLPALPGAPSLISVTAQAADALGLLWSSRPGEVVNRYLIERRESLTGIFTPTAQVDGGLTWFVDKGLDPGETYFYRMFAINERGESDPSNVISGTTHQQRLTAPEHVTATLMADGQVQINWDPGPDGATTVIEYRESEMFDFSPLGTADSQGPYGYYPGEPNTYLYRLKFVMDDNESPYAQTQVIYISGISKVYLPILFRH